MLVWLGGIDRGDADDVDGDRCHVGEDAVEVGGVSDHAGEPRCPGSWVGDGEVVTEVAEDPVGRVATDDDLVFGQLVHGLIVAMRGVS